ncbi:MAG: flagellar basal body rod protein FlgB [Spongiibacteraceae bacterium]|jgi:flagellar basal-body rod protein FlgB|nr:flagellar basal body rod protein FlgB [Spongiibacteraceae bacterium]
MAINLDQALGIHAHTLNFHVERTRLLASNLANVDTPGYLARDYDFKAAVAEAERRMARAGQSVSTASHGDAAVRLQALYRVPMQASRDGNTVELGAEQARFAENAMRFQTSLTFLNSKLAGLRQAIEG